MAQKCFDGGGRGGVAIVTAGSVACVFGGSGVTTTNGVVVAANTPLPYPVGPNDSVYVICATSAVASWAFKPAGSF